MRALFAGVWLAALAASAGLAWRGWRASRPFDVIRLRDAVGHERTMSRWAVWAPTLFLAFSGLALRAPRLAPPFVLFFLIWSGVVVYTSARSATALRAARDKGPT